MIYTELFEKLTNAIRLKSREMLPSGARVVLYGSRARGDFHNDSDWDIHILVPGNRQLSPKEINDYAFPLDMIGWEYGETISTIAYTYGDWERRTDLPFHANVEKDKIILL